MNKTKGSCPNCSGNHYLYRCQDFRSASLVERRKFVDRRRLCWNCFRPHYVALCTSTNMCSVCGRKHSSLLCGSFSNPAIKTGSRLAGATDSTRIITGNNSGLGSYSGAGKTNNPSSNSVFSSVQVSSSTRRPIRLQIVPVRVCSSNSKSKSVCCYAFLDPGATRSLFAET